jgi:hypothetical protein
MPNTSTDAEAGPPPDGADFAQYAATPAHRYKLLLKLIESAGLIEAIAVSMLANEWAGDAEAQLDDALDTLAAAEIDRRMFVLPSVDE